MTTANRPAEEREFTFTDREFKFLSGLARERTGIVLADHKRDMVYGRLVRRLRALKLSSFAEYCALLQSGTNDDEIMNLINAITTNLTHFFREGHHFEHLRDSVLAPLAKQPTGRFRMWSAACSSGMEPYSMAMVMKDVLPSGWDAKILATDIDTNMLNTGKAGLYSDSEFDEIPKKYQRYVDTRSSGNGQMQMGSAIQSLISFKQLNLLEAWPMQGPFDVIFCRNVVIYFDKPTKEALFDRMADILKPGGWLYIGHSENLHGISDRFKLIGRTTYQRTA